MSKKRKAEGDQPATLHDFFGRRPSHSVSPMKGTPLTKKQKTTNVKDWVSKSEEVGSSSLPTGKTFVPDGVEVIEIDDSDEELPSRGSGADRDVSSSRAFFGKAIPKARNLDEVKNPPIIQSDLNTSKGVQSLDTTSFFLDSPPVRPTVPAPSLTSLQSTSADAINDIEETEQEIENLLKRLSPEEWGEGEGVAFDTLSTGASEPEDEAFGFAPDTIENTADTMEVVDLEADDEPIELVDLSDDEAPTLVSSCPICHFHLGNLDEAASSNHVNRCLDKAMKRRANAPELTPPRSHKRPPEPAASTENQKSLNAFAFLMSHNKENEAWKEASEAEKTKWRKMDTKGKGKAKAEPKTEEIEDLSDSGETKNKSTNQASTSGNVARRPAPFYKVMQGMPIAVDAFRYGKIPGVTAYLLTHAHSDHYTNLSASWKHGPIYCSETTANLVIHMLNVDPKWVHPLPMDTKVELPDTGGVTVTLIQANHCPGSCLFLFEGKQTVNAGDSSFHSAFVGTARVFRYLHCGDFRACPKHVSHPMIQGKRLDLIYLDTTYLDPKYCFPPQQMVIDACAELALRIVKNGGDTNLLDASANSTVKTWLGNKEETPLAQDSSVVKPILVVLGTYTVGKERIVKAIARALNTSIYCEPRKRRFFECQSSEDPELLEMLGDDPLKCDVHVISLGDVTSDALPLYLEKWKGRWEKVLGIKPTGWTYSPPAGTDMANLQVILQRDQRKTYNWASLRPMRNSTPNVMLYGVPYSEHSSFFELTCFALSISYVRMIATVNVHNAKSRSKMSAWFEKWEGEKKRREREPSTKGGLVPRHEEYW